MNLFLRCSLLTIVGCGILFGRPFCTSDADIIGTSRYEFESGVIYDGDVAEIATELKHGLTQKMDLALAFAYSFDNSLTDHLSDAELGLKYALIPNVLLVAFTGELGEPAYTIKFILGQQIGFLIFSENVGYVKGSGEELGKSIYRMCAQFKKSKFKGGIEYIGSTDNTHDWLAGMKYRIFPVLTLDACWRGSIDPLASKLGGLGFCFEF